ncbi:MAG TPA: DUF4162 domain-containing protein, partial [Bacteroidales bacterium]|nr:DUF4162 domain-containing protein [Bacteroidales bacterium]
STHNMSSVEEICDHIALINKSKKILDGNINDVRNKYASGIYEFSFRGYFQKLAATLTASYEILETKEADGINTIKLRLLDKSLSENDLIRQMLNFGTITSFNMVTPSMNDIFIKAVGDARNQE